MNNYYHNNNDDNTIYYYIVCTVSYKLRILYLYTYTCRRAANRCEREGLRVDGQAWSDRPQTGGIGPGAA